MADRISKKARSRNMAHVRSKNTGIELEVRSKLDKMGYRFKLNSNLPGHPDIVLPKYKTAIFVHGCFWHQHGCAKSKLPETNREFWKEKLEGNKKRDKQNISLFKSIGWKVVILWECDLKKNKTKEEHDNFLRANLHAKTRLNATEASTRQKSDLR